jgi:hypothetical protein
MTSGKRQSRRRFLQGSAALAPSLALARAQAEESAQEPLRKEDLSLSAPGPATLAAADYKPGYFSTDEWRFVLAACDPRNKPVDVVIVGFGWTASITSVIFAEAAKSLGHKPYGLPAANASGHLG